MVSSRQRAQYEQVLGIVTKVRANCKHAQCFGFNKKQTRCQLCLNADRASSSPAPRCHHHHDKTDKLNRFAGRRHMLVYGFDPVLLTNSGHKFADDAIRTALDIFADKASARRIQIGWMSTTTLYACDYNNKKEPVSHVYICNVDDHWFTLAMVDAEIGTLILNSLRQGFEVNRRRIRRLRGMESSDGELVTISDLPQQKNAKDCGAFAIFYAYCAIYKKKIPPRIPYIDKAETEADASPLVRHQVVLTLLSKDTKYLDDLCKLGSK